MFALDSIVRNTIQQGVNFLAPEVVVEESDWLPTEDHPNLNSPVTDHHVSGSHLELEKSLMTLQNFIKRLAIELDSNQGSRTSTVRLRYTYFLYELNSLKNEVISMHILTIMFHPT